MPENITTNRATLFSANLKDVGKGFLTALITALITGAYLLLQNDNLPTWIDIRTLIVSSVFAGLSNIIKNFLTNSDGKFLKGEGK